MFGDNLKKYRTEKGLSQNDLAEKLFVTRQCVSKWENGTTQPDLQTLNKICELLEVSADTLVNEETGGDKKSDLSRGLFIVNILAAVFCILAFFAVWRYLPDTIPAHWGKNGIDRYGSRNEIFINFATVAAFFAVDTVMFFATRKGKYGKSINISHSVIAALQIVYLIFIIVLYAKYLNNVISFITCVCAALILCVSVAMHPKISRQNAILGVRTEETLNSVAVWNKTNALGCFLFSACSLIVFAVNIIWALPLLFLALLFLVYLPATVTVIAYAKIIAKTTD